MLPEFRNEPLTDFGNPENRKLFQKALAMQKRNVKRRFGLVIGGRETDCEEDFESRNPARPAHLIATFAKAGVAEAKAALDAAWRAFPAWSQTPVRRRAKLLLDAARIMRDRRHDVSAGMVIETGKTWIEADADTAEAIDFLEFYARGALRLQDERQPVTQLPDEAAELFYIPLGAGVVIPPWNFPVAILTGMTAAAIAVGNTVVLKPSSESPYVARLVFEIFAQAGMPPGVVNYLPGGGATAGEALVTHPKTRFVAFTGSMEVGLGIVEKCGQAAPGQIWIKRVIAEMGGKDTIVVDEQCDLDAVVAAVAASAFGFGGQKCSACSRVIVHATVRKEFTEQLVARVRKIKVGDPSDPAVEMGPVISAASLEKCLRYVGMGRRDGRLLTGGTTIRLEGGYFLRPTVFDAIPPGSPLDQEEIFGPVLAIIETHGKFEKLIEAANATDYGLTGAVFSHNREHLHYARNHFHVGNLYLNRKCTGALVGVHPFGGFNMSGTDSKAGGNDYLLLFTQAKSVAERLV